MAKMKVHELAKELGIQSKEIVALLQEKGFEIKAAASGIEDEHIAIVKAKYVKAAPAAEPKKEEPKAEAPVTEPKKEAPKADAPAPKAAPKKAPEGEAPKKKKKNIIFVSNPNNSKMPGGRPPMNNSQYGNNGRRPVQGQQAHTPVQPVKPIQLAPDEMINKATGKVMKKFIQPTEPEVVEAPKPVVEEPVVEPVVTAAPQNTDSGDRNNGGNRYNQNKQGGQADRRNNRDNSNGDRQNQGNFRNNGNGNNDRQNNNRFNGGNDRNQNRDSRQGNGFRQDRPGQAGGRAFAAPNMPGSKPNNQADQRRQNQAKDNKRSKKDALYEDAPIKNQNKAGRFIKPEKKEEPVEEIKVITIPETLTIKELADKMKMQPSAIIKKLFLQGQMVTVNQELTYEEAENIAIEFDIMCEQEVKVDVIEELLKEDEEAEESLVERAPVICVMGHVDHGKTSLLDAIRKTNVTDREAGGITQHIGAYTVKVGDRKITFLDTPGHEAFTAMRMRGANSTDIAILVVAADDGVMPQTVEAINHAKAAGIEIIVAVNKIDKPSANIEKVKQELTEYELISEDWGGSTVFVPVSAKSGEGIKDLLDMVLLTADVLELKANPKRKARGLVIEAELDKGRGPVATVLVQKGTLKVGDFVSAGASSGKVRAMIDDKGRRVKEAGPSIPVEILGLNHVPNAGEVIIAHDSDKTAKQFAETFIAQNKAKKLEETKSKMSLDDVFAQIQEGNLKELDIIVKADVQGSVEAVKQSLTKLSNEEVVVKCIHGGVGAINESDVSLAAASNAIIIGFNVKIDATAKDTAEREGVDVRLYKVIYQAIDDVEAAMKGMLDPVFEEKIIGHAEVRQIFKASAIGNIAGSYVTDGLFQRGCKVRIMRGEEQVYEGDLASLKRFKDDVKEVKAGYECGLVFDGYDQMQELDIVEAYIMVEVPR